MGWLQVAPYSYDIMHVEILDNTEEVKVNMA